MKPNVLVIYYLSQRRNRKTVSDHLFSFKRYGKGARFYYFNAVGGIPKILVNEPFDAVILDYTFFATRFTWEDEFEKIMSKFKNLQLMHIPKIGVPQDENCNLDNLWRQLHKFNVETIFTCAFPRDYHVLYPPGKTPVKHLFTVYPGYVDRQTVTSIRQQRLLLNNKRVIDIGYRARNNPFWMGRAYRRKAEIAEVVEKYCRAKTDLITDISTTPKDVFLEEEWLAYLANCKAVLGVESGSTLLYKDWSIRRNVEKYLLKHPHATYEEAEENCFPGQEEKVRYLTISPRLFEAAMTKTCQILLEGEYAGIVKPNIHYIELKKDYRNLSEVIDKFKNKSYRQKIVTRAYKDLIESGKYDYEVFVTHVINHIQKLVGKRRTKKAPSDARLLLTNVSAHSLFAFISWLNFTKMQGKRWYYQLLRLKNRIIFKAIILPLSKLRKLLVLSK